MAPCPSPNLIINGYYVGAKTSYSDGDQVHFICNSDYRLSGNPSIKCNATSSSWVGEYPTCNWYLVSNVWLMTLLAILAALVVILTLIIIIICTRIFCCRRMRIYDEEMNQWDESSACCGCCYRRRPSVNETSEVKEQTTKTKKTSPKKAKVSKRKSKVVSKKGGIRGRTKSAIQNKNVTSNSGEAKANSVKEAKKVVAWKPFANPVRNINTSTK